MMIESTRCCLALPLVTPKDEAKTRQKKANEETAGNEDGCSESEGFQTDDEEILAMEEARNEKKKTEKRGHGLVLPLVTPRDEAKTGKKEENKKEQNEYKSVTNPSITSDSSELGQPLVWEAIGRASRSTLE